MSKFVRIQTELRDVACIHKALDDLKVEWSENATWKHRYSPVQRPNVIVVNQRDAYLGIAPRDDAPAELLFDDMQKDAAQALLGKIQQRYAYHMVLAEAAIAGFELVEERTGKDQVIRMTVRRWS